MNQKVTLRFTDHVLTFEVPGEEVAEIEQDMRRKWLHRFVRANGTFLVNFDQVLWMKVSPGDNVEPTAGAGDAEVEWETRTLKVPFPLFAAPASTPVFPDGGKHGSL